MAKIVKSSLQLEALKEVNDGIKLMQKINKVMEDADESANGSMNIKLGESRIVYNNDADFVRKVLSSLKRDTLSSIDKKCIKFNIELDDADKVILGKLKKEVADENETAQHLEDVEDIDLSAEALDEGLDADDVLEPEKREEETNGQLSFDFGSEDDEEMPDAVSAFGSQY